MDELLRFGVVVESVTFPDLPMIEAINEVIKTPSLNLTSLLPRGIGLPDDVVANPTVYVSLLKVYLESLPHDTTRTIVFTVPPVMTFFVLVTTAARFYARRKISGKLRHEDWWAVVATVFSVTMMMMWIVPSLPNEHINGACGKHIWDISYNQLRTFLSLLNACFIIFSVGILVVRIQFLVFYYGLSPSKSYRSLLLGTGSLVLSISIASTFTLIFQCRPINYWDHLLTAKCINRYRVYGAMGWLTMATDVLLLLIPSWLILKLEKMKFWVKIQVIAVFAAGILVCVACIIRVVKVGRLVNAIDQPYLTPDPGAWGLVELDLATIISNIPTLRLYLSRKRRAARETQLYESAEAKIPRKLFLGIIKRPVASVFPISDWTNRSATLQGSTLEATVLSKDLEKGQCRDKPEHDDIIRCPTAVAVVQPIAGSPDLVSQSRFSDDNDRRNTRRSWIPIWGNG